MDEESHKLLVKGALLLLPLPPGIPLPMAEPILQGSRVPLILFPCVREALLIGRGISLGE